MSIQAVLLPKLSKADAQIQDKLDMILTNEMIDLKFPENKHFDLLEEPLVFSSAEVFGETEISLENVNEVIKLLRRENAEMGSVINHLNKEKNELKIQNLKLVEKLFTFENFEIEKFDHDFNQFLSRSIFLNYELSKKFLEKERENSQKMFEVIVKKDEEISSLKNRISLLEQKLLESRRMLKKTILETSPSNVSSQTMPVTESTGLGSMTNLDINKQSQVFKESPAKINSPTSQHDTTSDSSVRIFVNDVNRIMNNFQRKDLPQFVNQNQIEALMNEKNNVNFERLSANIALLEDQLSDDINPMQRHTVKGNIRTEASPTRFVRRDMKETKVASKAVNGRNMNISQGFTKPAPSSHLTSPKASAMKGSLAKSSSQKTLDLQAKFKSKTEDVKKDDENLTLSFLLDQNVSVDSISFPNGVLSSAAARELETEFKKGNHKEPSIPGSRTDTNTSQKKMNNTSTGASKTSYDTSKNKAKVAINTTPIIVKKKHVTETK